MKADADDKVRKGLAILSPPLPRPLPQPASEPAVRPPGLPDRHASSPKGRGASVAQWLRPIRNLRRAIIVATILGPPSK